MRSRILIGVITLVSLVSFLTVPWTSFQNKTSAAVATTLPPDFENVGVADFGVLRPTAIAFTPDGRLLITVKTGELGIFQNGALLPTPAINLSARLCANSERGLLGVVVDPNFASNNFIYLYYTFNKFMTCPAGEPTNPLNPVNRVSRFILGSNNIVDPGTESILIDNIHSPNGNNNGGDLKFGKDGFLYVGVGDGGADYAGDSGSGEANDAARDRHVLLGKILRITRGGLIPPTNPFQGAGTGRCNVTGITTPGFWCQETFASGLHNPRMAFDPNAGGTRFFINDEGQDTWEEVDVGAAGADYGWNIREGPCVTGSTTDCGPPPPGITNPLAAYPHFTSGAGCNQANFEGNSIRGGAFVPNGVWPAQFNGVYLFGEADCARIFQLTPTGTGGFTAKAFSEVSANFDQIGSMIFGPHQNTQALYYTSVLGSGQVRRVSFTGSNTPPQATILSPEPDQLFRVHEQVLLTGAAFDVQDGPLPDSSLRWEVLYHTTTQTFNYFISPPGNNIVLNTPPPIDLAGAPNIFLEIRLIATDSQGLSTTVSQFFQPRRVNILFATNPPGLQLKVNELTLTGPQTVVSWDGFLLNVNAPDQLNGMGQLRTFSSWSDGGDQGHIIVTPPTAATFTANFSGPGGASIGLKSPYYDNINFTALTAAPPAATVNFDFGSGRPPGTGISGWAPGR